MCDHHRARRDISGNIASRRRDSGTCRLCCGRRSRRILRCGLLRRRSGRSGSAGFACLLAGWIVVLGWWVARWLGSLVSLGCLFHPCWERLLAWWGFRGPETWMFDLGRLVSRLMYEETREAYILRVPCIQGESYGRYSEAMGRVDGALWVRVSEEAK